MSELKLEIGKRYTVDFDGYKEIEVCCGVYRGDTFGLSDTALLFEDSEQGSTYVGYEDIINITEDIKDEDKVNDFKTELQKAMSNYGDNHIAIMVEGGEVYGFYHSRINSFPVTNDYRLENLGGIKELEKFENLRICNLG